MEINLNISVNMGNPAKFLYENIRDYVWVESEDEDGSE